MKILQTYKYTFSFLFSALLVFYFIWHPDQSLANSSGDANSIWQTIISFNTKNVIGSYVLYKGILSVYPYTWLYELSKYLNLDQFLFIKIYYATLFGLSVGVAVPFIISELTSIKNNIYLNISCSLIVYLMIEFTGVFNQLMIDLPSFTFFTLAIYFYLKIKFDINSKMNFINIIFFGLFLGITFTGSGQYFLTSLILLAIYIAKLAKNKKYIIKYLIPFLLIFSFFFSLPIIANKKFERNFVNPMRVSGQWIPTSSEWLIYGISALMDTYKYDGLSYKSNRGIALMMDAKGDKFNEIYDKVKKGANGFTIKEYVTLIYKHPVDFLVMWGSKFFFAVSFDGGKAKINYLLFSYSVLFICLYKMLNGIKKENILKNQNFYLYLSILCTVAAPVFLHIEMRYCISLFSFMCFYAIYVTYHEVQNIKNKNNILLSKSNLQLLLIYLIFTFYSFVMYGNLLEATLTPQNGILFIF